MVDKLKRQAAQHSMQAFALLEASRAFRSAAASLKAAAVGDGGLRALEKAAARQKIMKQGGLGRSSPQSRATGFEPATSRFMSLARYRAASLQPFPGTLALASASAAGVGPTRSPGIGRTDSDSIDSDSIDQSRPLFGNRTFGARCLSLFRGGWDDHVRPHAT